MSPPTPPMMMNFSSALPVSVMPDLEKSWPSPCDGIIFEKSGASCVRLNTQPPVAKVETVPMAEISTSRGRISAANVLLQPEAAANLHGAGGSQPGGEEILQMRADADRRTQRQQRDDDDDRRFRQVRRARDIALFGGLPQPPLGWRVFFILVVALSHAASAMVRDGVHAGIHQIMHDMADIAGRARQDPQPGQDEQRESRC